MLVCVLVLVTRVSIRTYTAGFFAYLDTGYRKMATLPLPDPETDEVEDNPVVANKFANDGSFMEMFMKRLEEQKKTQEKSGVSESAKNRQDTSERRSPVTEPKGTSSGARTSENGSAKEGNGVQTERLYQVLFHQLACLCFLVES